jgi:hypothetical protein
MSENNTPDNDLGEEFRILGKNISAFFKAAMESPERQKLQADIESGMAEVVAALNKAASDFHQSETGKQLDNDLAELKQRIHDGEIEDKIRTELREVLSKVNSELAKGTSRWNSNPPGTESPQNNSDKPAEQ